MKKILIIAFVMLLSAPIWANPITLINHTCAPITCYLMIAPQPGGMGSASGFKVVPPNSVVNYASPVDFVNDATVTDLSNTIPAPQLPSSSLYHMRFFDIITMTGFLIDPNQTVMAISLPCGGPQYTAMWNGYTILFH